MPIDIKLTVRLEVEEAALEDALAEYDEITVSEIQQTLREAIQELDNPPSS